jgi:two-component system alkaline phosphatase synthesis response regulator PhoP
VEASQQPAPWGPLRILVVDDDENLRHLVAAYLEREGYEMFEAGDGPSALEAIKTRDVDLVILDLMLPGIDGLDVARTLRLNHQIPILMLTARADENDMLQGFEAGTDDYLIKPFSPKVLVARVKALLRRSGAETHDSADSCLSLGALQLSPKSREVRVSGREIELTSKEFDLLHVLAEHPGWVYTREELLESVWGYTYLGDSRLVDVHIANLRKKLGDDPNDATFIRTVRGVGYKSQPPTPPARPRAARPASE